MKKEKGYLILGLICLVCAVITGGLLLRYGLQSQKQQEQYDAIAQIYHANAGQPDEEALPDTDKTLPDTADGEIPAITGLQEINPDCVGWIQIPDTGLDYPVVYRDNQYYLTHNFMNEKASAGAVFLDISNWFLYLTGAWSAIAILTLLLVASKKFRPAPLPSTPSL